MFFGETHTEATRGLYRRVSGDARVVTGGAHRQTLAFLKWLVDAPPPSTARPLSSGGLVADIHGLLRDVPYLVEYASHKEVEVVLLDSNISLTCSTAGALCAKWVGPIPDPVVPRKLQHAVERVARALCPGAGDAAPSTFEWELTTICPLKRLFYSHYASPLFEDEYWMANEKEAPTRTDIKILRNATEVAIHPFEGLPLHVWHCLDLKKEAELNQSRSKVRGWRRIPVAVRIPELMVGVVGPKSRPPPPPRNIQGRLCGPTPNRPAVRALIVWGHGTLIHQVRRAALGA